MTLNVNAEMRLSSETKYPNDQDANTEGSTSFEELSKIVGSD